MTKTERANSQTHNVITKVELGALGKFWVMVIVIKNNGQKVDFIQGDFQTKTIAMNIAKKWSDKYKEEY